MEAADRPTTRGGKEGEGGGEGGSGGRKTVYEKVWVRCGPRSTDSSPELCPERSRKIYNADVFSRLALGLLPLLSSSIAESTKDGKKDKDERGRRGKGANRSNRR